MVKLRRQSTLPGRSGCDLATVRQVFVFVFGFFGFLQRNDIWSISWYDINSTHEHVVLLFIEFSDILKALTLKQIIMITRFMAASQRKHTNNQLRYRYRRPQKETTPPNGERAENIPHLNEMPRNPHLKPPLHGPPCVDVTCSCILSASFCRLPIVFAIWWIVEQFEFSKELEDIQHFFPYELILQI